jgi:hypothetical protein
MGAIKHASKIAKASRGLLWARWKIKITKPQAGWGAKPLRQSIAENRGPSTTKALATKILDAKAAAQGTVPLSTACRIQ